MKTLLYKQLRLVCHPMTPVFCLFGVMVLIPNYPYTLLFFYVMLGLFFTFLNMREQRDLHYTALLPVPKRDAVRVGCLFTAVVELLSLAVLVPCVLLAVRLQPEKHNLVGLNPNLALFAAGFLLYAVFNGVFLPSFYANGYKVGTAFIRAIVPAALAMLVCEALPHLPALAWIDALDTAAQVRMMPLLAGSIVIYAGCTVLAVRAAERAYERLDM